MFGLLFPIQWLNDNQFTHFDRGFRPVLGLFPCSSVSSCEYRGLTVSLLSIQGVIPFAIRGPKDHGRPQQQGEGEEEEEDNGR